MPFAVSLWHKEHYEPDPTNHHDITGEKTDWGSGRRQGSAELTHADMRFPHEEVPRDVQVAGEEVMTGGAVRASKKYHYGFKINYVVIKRLVISIS